MVGIEAPSIRLKALRLPPSSRIATFSLTPSSLAFATAASTIFCASSEKMPCFFTMSAIGVTPHLLCIARWSGGVVEIWTSCVQEERSVPHKQLGILKLRPVVGVGVDNELRVRDVLLHDEEVDRWHDHVVTARADGCWLLDPLQIAVVPLLLDPPLVHRFNLGWGNLVVHLGIAPLL